MDYSEENQITGLIIDKSIKIHKELGPGLFESVYEEILCYELAKTNIPFKRQEKVSVTYDERKLDLGFIADIIVDNKVIIELKSVEELAPVHSKQLLTYLKLTGIHVGLLINFNVNLLKNGIIRIAN